MNPTTKVLEDVQCERAAQDLKHGAANANNKPATWFLILSEEVGEVAKALLERAPLSEIRAELIQVAAVAVAIVEAVDRKIAAVAADAPK